MQNEGAVAFKLERAGIKVYVQSSSSDGKSQLFVSFSRGGKRQRERVDSLELAQKRAEAILQELLSENFPVVLGNSSVGARIYFTPTGKGYDAFTLVFYQDGKRKREQFGSLDDARSRGKLVVDGLSKGQIEAVSMTLQDQKSYLHSVRHLEGTGVSLESACREYAEMVKLLGGVPPVHAAREYATRHSPEVPVKTVEQVVAEFIAAKREGRATRVRGSGRVVSERYLDDLERRLKAFSGRFHCLIGAVTGGEINNFIHDLDVEGRTKNNYRQAINVLFEYARKQKFLPRDHAVMDEVEAAAEADFEINIFTPDELQKLLKHAHKELVPVLAIGAFAGLRTAEIERLEWSEINLKDGFIEVKAKKAKTRARRLAPVTENLAAWLKNCQNREGKVWPHSSPYLFELQAKAAADAEVPWKHNALRHSFISYRVAAIKNVDQVALEAGNSPEMIFQHYRELVTADAAVTWFSVGLKTRRKKKRKTRAGKGGKSKAKDREPRWRPANVLPMPNSAVA